MVSREPKNLMGHEILYCSKCQARLLGADFEKGRAFLISNQAVCLNCSREMMEALPPKEREAVLAASMKDSRRIPTPLPPIHRPPAGEPAAKSRTTVRHAPLEGRPVRSRLPWIFVSLGAAAVLALIVWSLRGPASNEESSSPIPTPPPSPSPPPPRKSPPPSTGREEAARDALKRARDFAAAHPSDVAGQVDWFRKALWEADKTTFQAEVQRELDATLSRERASLEGELTALDASVRDAVGKNDYAKALEILESSLPRHTLPDWKNAVDRKKKDVSAAREAAEGKGFTSAQDALRRRAWKDVKRIRAETIRLEGSGRLEALDRALAETSASIGLVAWWPFDETGGTAASDASGRGHEGLVRGKAEWRPSEGRSAGALAFDGSTTCVTVANRKDLNITGAITLAAWCRPDDWDSNRRLLQKGRSDNQYRITLDQADPNSDVRYFRFDLKNVGRFDLPPPPSRQWLHAAATYDGKSMKVYFNGAPAGEKTASGTIAASNDPLLIGTKFDGAPAGDHFKGLLDEIQIYDRALTPEDVAALARVPE
jgi:hypothetical protein